jgi:hypothetical protein
MAKKCGTVFDLYILIYTNKLTVYNVSQVEVCPTLMILFLKYYSVFHSISPDNIPS